MPSRLRVKCPFCRHEYTIPRPANGNAMECHNCGGEFFPLKCAIAEVEGPEPVVEPLPSPRSRQAPPPADFEFEDHAPPPPRRPIRHQMQGSVGTGFGMAFGGFFGCVCAAIVLAVVLVVLASILKDRSATSGAEAPTFERVDLPVGERRRLHDEFMAAQLVLMRQMKAERGGVEPSDDAWKDARGRLLATFCREKGLTPGHVNSLLREGEERGWR